MREGFEFVRIWFDHDLRRAEERAEILVEIIFLLSRLRSGRGPQIYGVRRHLIEHDPARSRDAQ